MPAYLVTLSLAVSGHTLVAGSNAMTVFAEDATQAKEICKSKFNSEGAAWDDDSTVTEIVQDADFNGWTFEVDVLGGLGAGSDEPGTATAVGDSTDNTVDEIAALLVIALNALTGIAGASYNSTTNILEVAASSDNLGDQTIAVKITPPNGNSPIPSLVGTTSDQGGPADVLSVVLPADDAVIPIVTGALKQV